MSNEPKKGLIGKFFDWIAKGRMDSTMAKLKRENPQLAKNIEERKKIDDEIDRILAKDHSDHWKK